MLKNFRSDIPGIFNEAYILKSQLYRFKIALNSNLIIPPYEVLIHPSGICNLKCQWCIGANIPTELKSANNDLKCLPSRLIDQSNMEKLIKNIIAYKKCVEIVKDGRKLKKEFKIERVQLSGIVGEPLIAKASVRTAIDLLLKEKITVGIFTNATLIDDEIIEDLLKLSYINISLDAGSAETYTKMKYGNDKSGKIIFKKLIENVKKLVDARNKSKSTSLKINASYVLCPDNYKDLFKAAKMMKEIGIDTLRMKQDNSGNHLLSQSAVKEANILLEKIEELRDDKFDFVKIHILNNPSEMRRSHEKCIITDMMAAIGSDGNVYPCNYHPRIGGLSYGDAIEEKFQDIWEGQRRKDLRRLLPSACPAVCDPFKNRANRLFSEIEDFQSKEGIEKTDVLIRKITNSIKINK